MFIHVHIYIYTYIHTYTDLPAPGPANVDSFMLSELTTTIFPGPFAEERGVPKGTIIGDTKTANEPSLFNDAVPTNLIVLFKILAYSKSIAPTLIMMMST
jgi:hypothetical protein